MEAAASLAFSRDTHPACNLFREASHPFSPILSPDICLASPCFLACLPSLRSVRERTLSSLSLLGPGQMPDGDSHRVTLATPLHPRHLTVGFWEGMGTKRKAWVGGVKTRVKNPECDVYGAGLSSRPPGGHMLGHHGAHHLNSGWE